MVSLLGVLRQPSASTGFGHALNIGTLVAAAETRDSPIEVWFQTTLMSSVCLPMFPFFLHFEYSKFMVTLVFIVCYTSRLSWQVPSSDVQDKIAFIMNNISITNLDQKAKECLEVLKDDYHPWFAQYMVMKR